MRSEARCAVCGASDWERINTLKHWWYCCNECNSVFARMKDRYLFSSPILAMPIKLLNSLFHEKVRFLESDFLREQAVIEDESVRYSQYARLLKSGSGLDPWNNALESQFARLDRLGIEYRGKRILCISGGPGVFAKKLSEYSEVVVTEFNSDTVKMMKEYLGLSAVQYDLNSDMLEHVVSGKFDLVIAESVINFCADQRSCVHSLKNILNDNAVVLISNDTASLGYMLTWQFEDYIPTTFIHNEAFLGLFYQAGGFSLIGKYQNKYNSYLYRVRTGGWKNKIAYLLRTPFWILYGGIALLPWKNVNRKLWSNNHITIMKYRNAGPTRNVAASQ
jgi:2-polyprenyl-3-methyl-5-hydroxy-6-metoxy-1,4-benzoquinol methylase